MGAKCIEATSAGARIAGFASAIANFMRSLGLFFLLVVFAPGAVSDAHAQPFAYVSNQQEDNVSVIDIATNTVVATVVVGTTPGRIVVTPDGAYAYVGSEGSDSVAVIETATNTVITAVPVGSNPFGIGISPDGTAVYALNYSSDDISVIDTATNTVVATISLANPTGADDVAFTPDGAFAYVTSTLTTLVSVVDTAMGAVVAAIPVGQSQAGIEISPDGETAYVSTGSFITVIDTATNTVIDTIPAGIGAPLGDIAITPDGLHAYVTSPLSVAVVDLVTNTVSAMVTAGSSPYGIAISPDGAYAYVANQGASNVSVIDTSTNLVVATVSVGNGPIAVAITPAGVGGDADGDGLADSVDVAPATPSDAFDDGGGTAGLITDRGGLTVSIQDAASPEGVRVIVGPGSGEVTLFACGFNETIDAGSELVITCGSVSLAVIQGNAHIVLNGTVTLISVPAGVTAVVTDNGDGTVDVQNAGGVGDVAVTVNGVPTTIAPGASQTYTVVYQFQGFFSPVDNLPTLNSAKGGSAIPVKFSLGGNQGMNIFAAGYPKSQNINCSTSAPLDAVEETVNAGASSLNYLAGADQYHYVWKTEKAWAGKCRQLILKLNDANTYVANFKFK